MNDLDLRRVRAKLGLSQTELAAEVGRCVRQYIRYEHGLASIPADVQETVLRLFSEKADS